MDTPNLFVVVLLLASFSYWLGAQRSIKVAGGVGNTKQLHSLPSQFGFLTALWCGLPALVFLLLWTMFESTVIQALLIDKMPQQIQQLRSGEMGLFINDIKLLSVQENFGGATGVNADAVLYYRELTHNSAWLKTGLVLLAALSGAILVMRQFSIQFKARERAEKIIQWVLMTSSGIAILTTVGIVLSVLFESITFFQAVSPMELLFGTQWSPQVAMRGDQIGSSGAFGAVPLFVGTLLITAIAMLIAVPIGLMTAIYLSNYASSRLRAIAKPMLELLAGIPTVVYGFFAALTVAPFIRNLGESLGLSVASESALAAGLVMGIMIIPFVSSLSDDAINTVPQSLKEGSLGMGATLSETIRLVLLPAALPGIVGAILLAISRAIGETMIVLMAAGLAANLTINPLESVTTVTVQIVTLLTGDQEFDSPKTLAAFALGLMLFVTTLALNILALKVVRKYREQYD